MFSNCKFYSQSIITEMWYSEWRITLSGPSQIFCTIYDRICFVVALEKVESGTCFAGLH